MTRGASITKNKLPFIEIIPCAPDSLHFLQISAKKSALIAPMQADLKSPAGDRLKIPGLHVEAAKAVETRNNTNSWLKAVQGSQPAVVCHVWRKRPPTWAAISDI